MNIAIWLSIGIAIAFAAGPITSGGSRRIDEKQLAKFQWRVGLPLPAELRAPVLGRISAHERWTIGGGLGGVALGSVASLLLPASFEGLAGVFILAAGAFGAGLAGIKAVLIGLRQSSTDAPRVARSVATELADYLPTGERRSAKLAPLLALLAGLLSVGLLVFIPRGDWLKGWLAAVPIVIVLTLVVTLTTTLVSRRVLEQGQRAASDLELAWDDLVRAQALRGIWANVIALGAISIFTSFAMVGDTVIRPPARAGAENLTLVVGIVSAVLALFFLLVLLLPVIRDRTRSIGIRHVLTRLWSDAPFVNSPRLRAGGDRPRGI